jgi:hypothetical protein
MDSPLQLFLREHRNLRIESAMSKYLLRKAAQAREPIPFFAIDARTGIPRREMLEPRDVAALLAAPSPS